MDTKQIALDYCAGGAGVDAQRIEEMLTEYSGYDPDIKLGWVFGTVTVGEFVSLLHAVAHPQAAGAGEREAIARLVDPRAFEGWQGQYDFSAKTEYPDFAKRCADHFYAKEKQAAFDKADAILALCATPHSPVRSATVEQGSQCGTPLLCERAGFCRNGECCQRVTPDFPAVHETIWHPINTAPRVDTISVARKGGKREDGSTYWYQAIGHYDLMFGTFHKIHGELYGEPEVWTPYPKNPEFCTTSFAPSVLDEIAAERQRQISKGYDAAHDDKHTDGSIARAAAAYAIVAAPLKTRPVPLWPWLYKHYQPGEPREALVKAAALCIAEIERLDRTAIAGGAK